MFCRSPAVVGELASKMLGYNLTTKQTPKDGVKVKTVSTSSVDLFTVPPFTVSITLISVPTVSTCVRRSLLVFFSPRSLQ